MEYPQFERRILGLIFSSNLPLTPVHLAYHLDIPISEARHHLDVMVAQGILELDSDERGNILYAYPMRPPLSFPARYRRAFFLLLDGARPDVFQALLGDGDLPNVARHVIERGGLATATTVFPSVTGVAYATYVTGCYPRSTNLPGVKWLD